MDFSPPTLFLALFLLLASLSSADYVNEDRSGLTCRNMRTFPFASCDPHCTTYSLDVHRQCQAKGQFGCLYRSCSDHDFQCAFDPQTGVSNSCANGEVQVREVTLSPKFPVEFDLAVNLKGSDLAVVLLIDASESTKPRLGAVKNELVSFVRQLNGSAHVSVVVYGGENSFDGKGMKVLSNAEEDVRYALNALEKIPVLPDGPRTSLTALYSLQRYSQQFSLRQDRVIIMLIGDTPGREPDCANGFDRIGISRSLFYFSNAFSVIPVSLGEPGLDAALTSMQPCANGSGRPHPQAVGAGQASKIAEETNGVVVDSITAAGLLEAVDVVRRKPNRFHRSEPGAHIFIYTQSFNPPDWYYWYPHVQPRINGCEDKVIVNMTGIPSFLSEPVQTSGKVKLDLPDGICQKGPFNCTIRIMDATMGYQPLSHWVFPTTYYKDISVQAC